MSALVLTALPHIPLIRQGDNLADIIVGSLQANGIVLEENDILVLAQKIVSKAEGRTTNLANVSPSARALELAQQTDKDPRLVELILQESRDIEAIKAGSVKKVLGLLEDMADLAVASRDEAEARWRQLNALVDAVDNS